MTPLLDCLELVTGADPRATPVASVVVLHGLGADGNDFVPIAQELDLAAVGPIRFVFPSAPVRPVTLAPPLGNLAALGGVVRPRGA